MPFFVGVTPVRKVFGEMTDSDGNRGGGGIPSRDRRLALLSPDDIADVLRTTRKAVYAMFQRGQLPAPIRVGRRLLIAEQDLLRWLAERRAVSPEDRR